MSGLPIVALLTADALGILAEFGLPQWGIFGQDGQPILVSDAVAGVEYNRQYDVSNYPQERGAFESYNKVQIPYDAKVTLLSGSTRQQLLSAIEPVVASLQLVTVVMPEFGYQSANVVRYGFRRTVRNGVTLIAVDVWCKEIRFPSDVSMLTGGTSTPVGQINSNSGSLAPGSGPAPSQFLIPGTDTPLSTGSTNAAYPTASGPIQPTTFFGAAGIPGLPGSPSGPAVVPPV